MFLEQSCLLARPLARSSGRSERRSASRSTLRALARRTSRPIAQRFLRPRVRRVLHTFARFVASVVERLRCHTVPIDIDGSNNFANFFANICR